MGKPKCDEGGAVLIGLAGCEGKTRVHSMHAETICRMLFVMHVHLCDCAHSLLHHNLELFFENSNHMFGKTICPRGNCCAKLPLNWSRFVVGIIINGIHAFSQKRFKLVVSGLESQRIITIKAIWFVLQGDEPSESKEESWNGAIAHDLAMDQSRMLTSKKRDPNFHIGSVWACLLYTSPSPRDQRGARMPSSA